MATKAKSKAKEPRPRPRPRPRTQPGRWNNRPAPLTETLCRMPLELRPLAVRGLVEGLAAMMRVPRVPMVRVEASLLESAEEIREAIDPARVYRFESADGTVVVAPGFELVAFLDRAAGLVDSSLDDPRDHP